MGHTCRCERHTVHHYPEYLPPCSPGCGESTRRTTTTALVPNSKNRVPGVSTNDVKHVAETDGSGSAPFAIHGGLWGPPKQVRNKTMDIEYGEEVLGSARAA
jgi:hypothetical protein